MLSVNTAEDCHTKIVVLADDILSGATVSNICVYNCEFCHQHSLLQYDLIFTILSYYNHYVWMQRLS